MLASPTLSFRCVWNFWTDKERFDMCKKRMCFIYVPEGPFVFPNAEVSSQPPKPFLCYNSRLKGQIADTLLSVGRKVQEGHEAYCVYGGNSCRFDDILTFVRRSRGSGHRFIAGSYLVFLPYRRSDGTIHSAPFISDEIVLMQGADPWSRSWREARNQIIDTFSPQGWGVVFGLLAGITVLYMLYFYVFQPRHLGNCKRILWFTGQLQLRETVRARMAWNVLLIVVTVFFTTLILTFEISAAVNVFRGQEPVILDMSQVTVLKPSEIAVVRGSASEAILRRALLNEGLTTNSTKRWVAVKNIDEAINALLQPNNPVKYVFEFEKSIKYSLSKRSLCEKVIGDRLQKKDFGGWYYSPEVSSELRTRVDKELLRLVLEGDPEGNVRRYGQVDFSCGENTTNLDHKILTILFGFAMLIPALVYLFLLSPIRICGRILLDFEDESSQSSSNIGITADIVDTMPTYSSSESRSSEPKFARLWRQLRIIFARLNIY